jgi:septum formation protein
MSRLILASASRSRARMLKNAGISTEAIASGVDEDAIKQDGLVDGLLMDDIAMALAQAKALAISAQHPNALVIGADQILVCEGQYYDKPRDMTEARKHLQALSGKRHELLTAACVAAGNEIVWQHISAPQLRMRVLDESFIATYLETAGPMVMESVGAYQLEGRGAQLFDHVDGDFFSILGLPLLPLLAFLREQGPMS